MNKFQFTILSNYHRSNYKKKIFITKEQFLNNSYKNEYSDVDYENRRLTNIFGPSNKKDAVNLEYIKM